MSLIDLASLVLAPTATKEGKVYSAIPDTGEGDMTFTRGSAATRVNSAGLIEKERGNILYESNNFSSGYWNYRAGDSSTGGQAGYDGTNDAWLLSVTNGGWSVYQNYVGTGVHTFSLYVKAGTANIIQIDLFSASTTYSGQFNLSNGTDAGGSNTIDRNIISVGGGWYRVSFAANISSTLYARIGTVSQTGNFYIQDAQLEYGLVATDYIPTTTSAVYEGITDDVPRVDYSGGGCPSLLLEPQRTNLFEHSEYFNDATNWFKYSLGSGSNPVVTDNYAVSPEGVTNAARLQLDAGGSSSVDRSRLYTNISVTSGTDYTFTFYAKSNTGNNEYLKPRAQSVNYSEITITTEWQRFDVSFEAIATGSYEFGFECRGNHTENAVDISIYGAQLEAGSYSTSYIPTYSVSSTRVADSCSKTGISELIGQTEGTLFLDFVLDSVDGGNDFRFDITQGTSFDNEIFIGMTNGDLRALIRVSASNVYDSGNISATVGTRYKMAMAYANNDVALYINGTQEDTSSSATIPNTDEITIGNRTDSKAMVVKESLSQAILFPTRLTNDQLEELTK